MKTAEGAHMHLQSIVSDLLDRGPHSFRVVARVGRSSGPASRLIPTCCWEFRGKTSRARGHQQRKQSLPAEKFGAQSKCFVSETD